MVRALGLRCLTISDSDDLGHKHKGPVGDDRTGMDTKKSRKLKSKGDERKNEKGKTRAERRTSMT